MSGILKVGGSELINDNGGSGSLQWGSGAPTGSVLRNFYDEANITTDITLNGVSNLITNVTLTITGPNNTSDYLLVSGWLPVLGNANHNVQGSRAGLQYSTVSDFSSGVATFGSNFNVMASGVWLNDSSDNSRVPVGALQIRANHPTTSTYYVRMNVGRADSATAPIRYIHTADTPLMNIVGWEIKG